VAVLQERNHNSSLRRLPLEFSHDLGPKTGIGNTLGSFAALGNTLGSFTALGNTLGTFAYVLKN
jgi:hypothetical protein